MRAAVALIALAAACDLPPAGQVALHIDTDAIVAPSDVPSLFDTLRVDVYEPGASAPCKRCSRTFSVTSRQFKDGAVSFGVPERPRTAGYRARLRLYSARASVGGEPPAPIGGAPPPSVIDTIVELPPVEVDGVIQRRVRLLTDDVGLPKGTLDAPAPLEIGRYDRSLVNTWTGAARVPCQGAPNPGEVCVPGGAFWMGNPAAPPTLFAVGDAPYDAFRTDIVRLVVLSPFYLDATAATVGELRAQGFGTIKRSSGAGSLLTDFCTFTDQPSSLDDYPVNCINFKVAERYCAKRGSQLATEAQMEYVAGALESRLFAWGEDPELACDELVFGRTGYGLFASATANCKPKQAPGGPLQVGSLDLPRRDVVKMPFGGAAFDVLGNMSTWVADAWSRQTEPCWSHGGVYVDPVCDGTSVDGPGLSVRGGSWYSNNPTAAASRSFVHNDAALPQIGVRCARGG